MWTRRLQTSRFVAFFASVGASSSRTAAFSSSALLYRRSCKNPPQLHHRTHPRNTITQQHMSFFGGPSEAITRIDKAAMTEIIDDVANSSREDSGYCIIDVRGHDEIQFTGKLNDVVETLPLPLIAQGALAMDNEDFKDQFGFDKPALDETLVFTCKAGIRSQQAGQLAKMAGYTDILDYMGGSNEWFS